MRWPESRLTELLGVCYPVVAPGGMVDGSGIAAALARGADGVQLGTAFVFRPESSASLAWRRALRELPTVVTDAYTGRPAARGPRSSQSSRLGRRRTRCSAG